MGNLEIVQHTNIATGVVFNWTDQIYKKNNTDFNNNHNITPLITTDLGNTALLDSR